MSKRRMVWPWIIALSLATVIQFLCLFLRVADNLEGIRNIALGFGTMLTGAILFCVLWGLPNVRRVRTLRQQFPEAVVLGVQVHHRLDERLVNAFPHRPLRLDAAPRSFPSSPGERPVPQLFGRAKGDLRDRTDQLAHACRTI